MLLVKDAISLDELKKMSENMYGRLVKAVVDVEKEIMVVDAPLHADQEFFLLEELESKQENLWGINIIPDKFGGEGFIVFDSMINHRFGNRSRGIDDPKVQELVKKIVHRLVVA